MAESVFEPCAISDGPIKVDALGSIISNCTILQSNWDDAKYDVDRARYGDEGKNLRRFVSIEQIPLSDGIILDELLLKHANNLS